MKNSLPKQRDKPIIKGIVSLGVYFLVFKITQYLLFERLMVFPFFKSIFEVKIKVLACFYKKYL
jgi:hypothetical protein